MSEAKLQQKARKQKQILSKSRFVLRIAPPSLSRDRGMKMKKFNQVVNQNRC